MTVTKKDIGRISSRIQAVWRKHRPYLREMILSLLKDPSVFAAQAARHFEGDLMPLEKRLLRMLHRSRPFPLLRYDNLKFFCISLNTTGNFSSGLRLERKDFYPANVGIFRGILAIDLIDCLL